MNVPGALKKCPLFLGIEESQLASLLDCLKAMTHKFCKDEFVFVAGDNASVVGIVLSGGVRILQEDFGATGQYWRMSLQGDYLAKLSLVRVKTFCQSA